jgi:tetratricopeptide (TPR) repeat protein
MSDTDANEEILNEAREIVERLLEKEVEPLNENLKEDHSYKNFDEYDCFEYSEETIDLDDAFVDFIPASGSYKQFSLEKIVDAAASKGALEAATKAAMNMKPSKHQRRALETIIKQHVQADNIQEAYRVCLLATSPVMKVQLLSQIHYYENVEGYNEACEEAIKETLTLVNKGSVKKAPALTHVAFLLANVCEMDSALKTVDGIDDVVTQIRVRCRVAEVYAEKGYSILSQRMFSDVIQAANNIQKISTRDLVLEKIAEAKLRLGDIVGALLVTEAIGWDVERAEYLNYGLEVLPTLRLFGSSCVWRSYTEELGEVITRQRVLRRIAEAQALKGDFGEAVKTANLIGWDIERVKTLTLIGKESVKSGEEDYSKMIFADAAEAAIESKHLDMDKLLTEIIIEEARLGDLEQAYKYSMHLKALYYRVEALAKIGVSCARVKGYTDAQKYFEEALGCAREIYDVSSRVNNLIKVALSEAEAGGIEAARITISTAKESADGLKDWYPRFDALKKIAVAEEKTGQHDKSRQTFRDAQKIIEPENTNLHAITELSINQIEAGFKLDAVEVAKKKLYSSPSSLASVASAFLERGDMANFLSTLNLFPRGKQKDAEMYVTLAQAYPEKAGEIAESLANNIEDDDIGYLLSSLVIDINF